METVYIVVLDYCSACVKTYEQEFEKGWQDDDVKLWLLKHTDYDHNTCCYMVHTEPIEVIEGEIND